MLIGAQKVLYDNDPWPLRPQALTQAFERDSQRTDEIQQRAFPKPESGLRHRVISTRFKSFPTTCTVPFVVSNVFQRSCMGRAM